MSAPISNHSLTLHNENDLHYFLATPCENRASLSKLVLGPEGRGPAHDRRRPLVIRDCSAFGAAILRSPSLATVKCENVRWASDDILHGATSPTDETHLFFINPLWPGGAELPGKPAPSGGSSRQLETGPFAAPTNAYLPTVATNRSSFIERSDIRVVQILKLYLDDRVLSHVQPVGEEEGKAYCEVVIRVGGAHTVAIVGEALAAVGRFIVDLCVRWTDLSSWTNIESEPHARLLDK